MNIDITVQWATTPPVDFPPLRDGINDRLPVMVSNYGYGCHGVFVCVYLVLRNLLPMGRVSRHCMGMMGRGNKKPPSGRLARRGFRVSRHCMGMIKVIFPWVSWNVKAFRLSR